MKADLTTGTLLDEGIHRLVDHSETPRLDAELLLAEVLDVSRARFRSHPEEPRSTADRERYAALLTRRATGEPLAYILGYKEFWSLRLHVTPAVLVPRPETELLVERALALRTDAEPTYVADLGTGSGAIALAIAHERPLWKILATDLSTAALQVARANAGALHLTDRVEFLEGPWLKPLANRRMHLILSNPPYIAANDAALLQPTLRFEPLSALTPEAATPGVGALADLRTIVRDAPAHLERGGWLLLEHGAGQASEVSNELVLRGFRHVRSHRDLAGHERMTEGQWP